MLRGNKVERIFGESKILSIGSGTAEVIKDFSVSFRPTSLSLERRFIKDGNNKNVTKTSLSKLGNNLIDKLDDIPELLQATTIDIENQPALKNPTMKSVQMILYTYFLIHLKNKKYSLNLVSARNKLKFDLENEDIKETKKITDNYKKNKKLAIDFTREFLKNTPDWLEYFENYKNKKDDLADAYLMIRYRLKTI